MALLRNFPSQGLSAFSWGVSGARTSREGVCICTAPSWAHFNLLRVSSLLQPRTSQAARAAPAPRHPELVAPCKYTEPKHNPPLGRGGLSAHRCSHQRYEKPWAPRKRLSTSTKLTGRQTQQQGSRATLPAPAAGRTTRGTRAGHGSDWRRPCCSHEGKEMRCREPRAAQHGASSCRAARSLLACELGNCCAATGHGQLRGSSGKPR